MKKLFYLTGIITLVWLIYILYDTYYDSGTSEIVTISPIKYPYKKPANNSENLLSKDSHKSLYENFTSKNDKNLDIKLLPEPETAILINEKSAGKDIFLTEGISEEKGDIFTKTVENNNSSSEDSVWQNFDKETTTQEKSLNVKKRLNSKTIDLALSKSKQKNTQYYAQLGYFRSSSIAQSEWMIIKERNKKLIEIDNHIIKKVKNKNNFHFELNMGPYKDFKHAKHICKKISLKNQKCVVIKD